MIAIIPAAGLGTRFLPATKAIPKEMLPVLNKPTIQYVVEEALAADVDTVVIITNDNKPAIREHFSSDEALVSLLESTGKSDLAAEVRTAGCLPVSYLIQEKPLGLGHAVYCASELVRENQNELFYVLLGDVLVPGNQMLQQMTAVSRAHENACVIAVLAVPDSETYRFGIVAGVSLASQGEPQVWRITGLVEKPQSNPPSNLAVFGRYLLTPKVMELLGSTEPGVGNEIQLTDALIELLETEEMYALVIDPDDGYDVGTVNDWLNTNNRMAARALSSAGQA
ncbi:MAG: NTP transferase domain-containing protein [Coriobacteriales bacterium]|jgi:UTP--glucose-1-phosphate uridylyltransferase|nr:NTP transferase domain-containing protein [Coriobacteriales bacterium]